MSGRIKQRLIGVLVLVVIAAVFLPVLFTLEPPRTIDENTQIPVAPEITPALVEQPIREADMEQPKPHKQIFLLDQGPTQSVGGAPQPEVVPLPDKAETVIEPVTPQPSPRAEPDPAPTLAASGLPSSWVVQVASFREKTTAIELAEKMKKDGHKAFVRTAVSGAISVHRVFVGPQILKARAEEEKQQIDRKYKVNSLVLAFEP